ncbi:MAG: hypothetical protein JST80_03025 [Bdellovibrionales bacterium]|nr:hypothetical protein [Bdellovibrionales bacterium]
MDVVITEWAFQSYLDLKHKRVFTSTEYKNKIRPSAELLKDGLPSPHSQFRNPKFWGPATDLRGNPIANGYKMKWHNIGYGKVQLRLAVAHVDHQAFLCRSYVKIDEKTDRREMAKFKIQTRDLFMGKYVLRGHI